MTCRRLPAECHSDVTPAGLPRETTDTHQETEPAAQHRSSIALMLSSTQSVRSSNHEGVLTTVNHTSPSPSVSRAPHAIHLPRLRMGRQAHRRNEGELPPSVRSTGGGGLRALARKTEGVRRGPRSGRIGPVDQFEQRTPERKRGPGRVHRPGSGSSIRVPREGGDPVLLNKKAREALRIPTRHSGFPPPRETRRLGLTT